jgi:hypothetical protein
MFNARMFLVSGAAAGCLWILAAGFFAFGGLIAAASSAPGAWIYAPLALAAVILGVAMLLRGSRSVVALVSLLVAATLAGLSLWLVVAGPSDQAVLTTLALLSATIALFSGTAFRASPH